MLLWVLTLLLHSHAKGTSTETYAYQPAPQTPGSASEPRFCFVVRTYWGHAEADGLQHFFASLQAQQIPEWEAILLVLDSKPFEALTSIVQGLNDTRVWTFAEWIGVDFNPRKGSEWAPGYHHLLYNLTDEAIRACPPSTEWVIVTNGDNDYADTLLSTLRDAPKDSDVVALDYYSRLSWCHTDLGANILRWPRLISEDRRFGSLAPVSGGLPPEHFDGIMVMDLQSNGWVAHHVQDRCLFDHDPSPQRCARQGGVWEETQLSQDSPVGGRCLSPTEALQYTQLYGSMVQEVEVNVSTDGHMHHFAGGVKGRTIPLRCLHRKDIREQWEGYVRFFGIPCFDDSDLVDFERSLLQQEENNGSAISWPDLGTAEAAREAAVEAAHPSASSLQSQGSWPKPKPPKPPPRDSKEQPSFRRRVPSTLA